MGWLKQKRIIVIFSLTIVIVVGGGVLLYRQAFTPHSIEITLPPSHEIIVEVVGAVENPGLYTLREGDRVGDAIEAAGGALAEADMGALELTARLSDGQRVAVYEAGEVPQRVNINTADSWLLEALPGIGPALAQRIVDYRDENGPFQGEQDLMRVKGIGPETYEGLKDYITAR